MADVEGGGLGEVVGALDEDVVGTVEVEGGLGTPLSKSFGQNSSSLILLLKKFIYVTPLWCLIEVAS